MQENSLQSFIHPVCSSDLFTFINFYVSSLLKPFGHQFVLVSYNPPSKSFNLLTIDAHSFNNCSFQSFRICYLKKIRNIRILLITLRIAIMATVKSTVLRNFLSLWFFSPRIFSISLNVVEGNLSNVFAEYERTFQTFLI